MISARALLSRSAPLLACLGLLGIWQVAALMLNTDSFPTALEAIAPEYLAPVATRSRFDDFRARHGH